MNDPFLSASSKARELLLQRVEVLKEAIMRMTSGGDDAMHGILDAGDAAETLIRHIMSPILILRATTEAGSIEAAVKEFTDHLYKAILAGAKPAYELTKLAEALGIFGGPLKRAAKEDEPPKPGSPIDELNTR